jgi:hypothetical protein
VIKLLQDLWPAPLFGCRPLPSPLAPFFYIDILSLLPEDKGAGQAVSFYRFYKLDKRRHIEGLPEAIDCKDDADAIAKAEDRSTTRAIEIWDLGRRVAVVEAGAKIRGMTRRSPR